MRIATVYWINQQSDGIVLTHRLDGYLTTEHSASSYGLPVFVPAHNCCGKDCPAKLADGAYSETDLRAMGFFPGNPPHPDLPGDMGATEAELRVIKAAGFFRAQG